MPSGFGTDPKSVVLFAEAEFQKSKEYDQVFVVFDRDDHASYATAIEMAEARDEKNKNIDGKKVRFHAVVSVPSFEFWLLIHYEELHEFIHRDEVYRRLRRHIKDYTKGRKDIYAVTCNRLLEAIKHGKRLKERNNRIIGTEAYTDVHELVDILRNLRK